MALGRIEKESKYYLSITKGKIVHSAKERRISYDFVEGTLEAISVQERTFNGEKVLYWYIPLRGEKGELYILSLPYKSGVFKSIILALASEPTLGRTVKIEPYERNGFTKVVVSLNGKRLDWITKELPPVESVQIAGQPVKDDTKRMVYISQLVEVVNKEGTKENK